MSIYNKYGMLPLDDSHKISNVARGMFEIFKAFAWYRTLPKQRQYFHEVINDLNCCFAEHILTEAMKLKKEKR